MRWRQNVSLTTFKTMRQSSREKGNNIVKEDVQLVGKKWNVIYPDFGEKEGYEIKPELQQQPLNMVKQIAQ